MRIGVPTAVSGPRRRPSFLVRVAATFLAKLIFFGIYTFLVLVLLVLLRHNWPELDLYVIAEKVVSFFKQLR